MQERHMDRLAYFTELANTSREFYLDYLDPFFEVRPGMNILEVGCGEGGNLLPFAEKGCIVKGIDACLDRIEQAKEYFSLAQQQGTFECINFFDMEIPDETNKFDLVLIHDVIEHIEDKETFISKVKEYIKKDGIIFWGFPAWQMPFGGHQQICSGKISKLPFIHLLPMPLYSKLLQKMGESDDCITELQSIKKCALTIENFEKLIEQSGYNLLHRKLWFINPHYKQKFNLMPIELPSIFSNIKYVRNFFSTACFYVTQR
ncbi:MAG: class I SAM-dependent methyltransferase [Tannerellaceae bacterium]